MATEAEETSPDGRFDWLRRHADVIVAVLLGLAAILGAGASFRQSLDDGSAALALSAAEQLRTGATAYLQQANQKQSADLQILLEYEQATHTGQAEYATYLRDRAMDDNLRRTVAWWDLHPEATNPFVDGSPYVEPLYVKAAAANAEADAKMEEYANYDDRATGYIKVVTLLAVSLFMFGIAAVVSRVSLRLSALVIGIGVMGWSFFILVRTLLMKV